MNIYNLSQLQQEAAWQILDALTDVAEGVYYSDLIIELESYFEMIYTNEARAFVIENIEEVLEALEDINANYCGLDFLFKDGLDVWKLANVSYLNIVERVYYEFLNEFENTTGTDLTNARIWEDDEDYKAFKTFIREVLNTY